MYNILKNLEANSDTFELKESEKNSRNLSKYLTDFKP